MRVYDGTRSERLVTVADEHHQARVDDIIHVNRRVKQLKIVTQLGIYNESVQIIIFKMNYRILYDLCRYHSN